MKLLANLKENKSGNSKELPSGWTLNIIQITVVLVVFGLVGGILLKQVFATSGGSYNITSSLVDESTITGKVVWTAAVSPAPYEVDFYIDGVKDSHIENYAPYQYKGDPSGVLDTTLLSNGKHTFQEVAIYDKGSGPNITSTYLQNLAVESAIHVLNVSNSSSTSSGAPIVSLSANPASIAAGQTSILTWTSANASSCVSTGGWSGTKATSGTFTTPVLSSTTSYSLSCTGAGGTSLVSTTVIVSSTPPVSSNPTCSKVLAAGASILSAYTAAHAGDVICLPAGAVFTGDIDFRSGIGSSSAPLIITSQDVTRPATIKGRLVFHAPASWVTISHLKLDGINGSGLPSPTIGSDHVSIIYNEITDENTSICVNIVDNAAQNPDWGTAHYTLIDHNRIHNCGPFPSTNRAHGIYDIGYYTTITNNYVYDNVDRGIQLRMDQNATVKYNVSDGNGEGMIIGETTTSAVNDEIAYNIFSNSNIRYNIEYYWPSGTPSNANNKIHDNCVWTTRTDTYSANNSIEPGFMGAVLTNNIFVNPLYNNRSAKDFTLSASSPCAAYGPR